MTASFWFWWCRGYTLEGEGWLSQLYDRVKELAVEVDPALLAEARARQAMLLSMTHRGDQLAYHVAEEALQLAEALGDDHKRIRAMAWLALCWNALSYKLVNTFGRQCLAIAEEIGDRFLISEAVDMLYQTEPDLAKAKALLDRRLRLEREIGDEDGLVSSYLGLGGYYFNTGDFTQAFQMLDKQIQIAQKLGNRGFAVLGFYYQGYLFLDLGEVDKAIEALEQSLEEALVLGLPLIFLPYIFLGYAYGLKRDWSEAERDLQRVIVIARENHNDFWENYAVFSLAEVAWSLGKVETAKEYYQEAAELSQGYRTIGLGNYAAGMLAFLNESPAAAEGFFLAALKDCAAAGLFPGIAECLEALALCTIQEERFEKAVHLHGVAVSLRDWRRYIYYYGGSTLIWGTVKAALEPVQAALGESRYAQLLQEGQAVSGNFIYRRMVVHPDVFVRIFVDEGQQRHTILRPDWAAVCNPVFPVLDGQYYPEYHLWGMTIMPSWGYAKGVIDTHYY